MFYCDLIPLQESSEPEFQAKFILSQAVWCSGCVQCSAVQKYLHTRWKPGSSSRENWASKSLLCSLSSHPPPSFLHAHPQGYLNQGQLLHKQVVGGSALGQGDLDWGQAVKRKEAALRFFWGSNCWVVLVEGKQVVIIYCYAVPNWSVLFLAGQTCS